MYMPQNIQTNVSKIFGDKKLKNTLLAKTELLSNPQMYNYKKQTFWCFKKTKNTCNLSNEIFK